MATFAELRTSVQSRLIDAPSLVTSELGAQVNAAIRNIQDRMDFAVNRATADFTTTVSTRAIGAIPADFHKFRDRPYYVEDTDGHTVDLIVVPSQVEAALMVDDQDEDAPKYLVLGELNATSGAGSILVYPLPDGFSDYTDGEYRIKLPYWRYLADLSADSDHNVFTDDDLFAEYIVERACSKLSALDWDTGGQSKWLSMAEMTWKEIRRREAINQLAGVQTFVPRLGARAPRIPN